MRHTLALFLLLPALAAAQAPARPPVACKAVAAYSFSQGASWDDVAVADHSAVGAYSPVSTDRIGTILVVNTHATQHIYLLLRASAAEATTAAIEVRAGAALALDIWGANAGVIAVQGSGVATTGRITTCWSSP